MRRVVTKVVDIKPSCPVGTLVLTPNTSSRHGINNLYLRATVAVSLLDHKIASAITSNLITYMFEERNSVSIRRHKEGTFKAML